MGTHTQYIEEKGGQNLLLLIRRKDSMHAGLGKMVGGEAEEKLRRKGIYKMYQRPEQSKKQLQQL